MNSVHLVTQEKLPSRKTGLKTKPGARAPKLAQLGTQARTGARMPGRVVGATTVSWPSFPVVSLPAWPYRSVRRVLRPSAMSQRLSSRVAGRKRPYRKPCRAPLAVSWAWQCIVSRHNALPCLLSFNWLQSQYNVCIVTQPASPAKSLAIHCNTHLASSCHNTLTVLRHTSLPSLPPLPQYTLLYCDTTSLHQPAIQPLPSNLLLCNTHQCVAIHLSIPTKPKSLQYNTLYCNTKFCFHNIVGQ